MFPSNKIHPKVIKLSFSSAKDAASFLNEYFKTILAYYHIISLVQFNSIYFISQITEKIKYKN